LAACLFVPLLVSSGSLYLSLARKLEAKSLLEVLLKVLKCVPPQLILPGQYSVYVGPIQNARQGKKPDRKSPEMAQFPLSFYFC